MLAATQTFVRPIFGKQKLFVHSSRATVFLGAFLLFLVEPTVAKMLLPFFGGSAAVWATCLVFFQTALLLGYYYAHVATRFLAPSKQAATHIALLLVSLVFLPLLPSAAWKPRAGADPAWSIALLLTAVIGLPFALLSSTSPMVQNWFEQSVPEGDPYPLFALSNLASFAALLCYPFLIEPRLPTGLQGQLWSALYVAFALLCSLTLLLARRVDALQLNVRQMSRAEPVSKHPTLLQQLHWLALSACGSMLLLTVTNHLTQNVTPVPLLWVLPLALYLLSFTLVFSRRQYYRRWLFMPLFASGLLGMGYALYNPHGISAIQISVPLFCAGLFFCCMFCHGELNQLRPAGGELTAFYLMVAAGGAIGAFFVGIIAPHVFSSLYEFPGTLLFTALLAVATRWKDGWNWRALWLIAAGLLSYVLVTRVQALHDESIYMTRNFYGALRVTEENDKDHRTLRTLYHGTIRHGSQYLDAKWRRVPLTYYSFDSGIGLALQFCCSGPKRVGVIGLGTGTLAAYGKKGDFFHFYDIDPDVVHIAKSLFTYLNDTPARKELTLGDARLSLEGEEPQQFDVLAVDAFSGDAIPVHLLTAEAIDLYLKHLKPNGILAIHTSNSFLVLDGVVKRLADHIGFTSKLIASESSDDLNVTYSDWVLVSRNGRFMNSPLIAKREEAMQILPGIGLWTDDRNNLFEILKPLRVFPQGDD